MPNQIFQVSGTPTQQTKGISPFEQMMARLNAANNMDWQTLLGFGVGRLLRGLFDDWKERYDARGIEKAVRNRKLNDYFIPSADYSPNSNGMLNSANKYSQLLNVQPQADTTVQAQPDTTGINTALTNQFARKLLGKNNSLTSVADEQYNNLPVTNPWDDENNWNKYLNFNFRR